jgi:diguanylate cyclase (GGDEF)-like protein
VSDFSEGHGGRGRAGGSDTRIGFVMLVLMAIFLVDIHDPDLVMQPFLAVPVVAAAIFARPRAVGLLALLAIVLSLLSGAVDGRTGTDDWWVRMTATALVALVAMWLADNNQQRHRTLFELSTRDPLTGLPNRRLLLERMDAQLSARAPRSANVIVYADLDGFKQVNSEFGHTAGDEVLVEVARRLAQCVREGDTIARFGGDEFVIACPSVIDEAGAAALCRRIMTEMAHPFQVGGGRTAGIGITLGAVVSGQEIRDAHRIIDRADQALMHMKTVAPGSYRIVQITGADMATTAPVL